jgi:hypothetical protein
MKHEPRITEQQVQEAVQVFLRDGKLIQRLPPEVVPLALLVGGQHGGFEPVSYYAHAEALLV